ncbi:unnamed protein product [Oreochromis niloticus]|nr:unnamed protein product [Mustela putorius furo]
MAAGREAKLQLVQRHVRAFPDFPKKGIVFRDICPILKDAAALKAVIDLFEEHVRNNHQHVDLIVGLDARGFLFGPLLAQRLGIGFVPVRKKGKLPGATVSVSYDLEYGKKQRSRRMLWLRDKRFCLLMTSWLLEGRCMLPPN